MKKLKVVLGFFVIYGIGKEYIAASKQLGTLRDPGIIVAVLLMLLLATWLIGSGLSQEKFSLNSLKALKFHLISFVSFLVVAFLYLILGNKPYHIVEINGLNVPLGKCVDGHVNVISDLKEREEYCACVVEKITDRPKLKTKYQDYLEDDKFNIVYERIQQEFVFAELNLDKCLNSVELSWTDQVALSMKNNWIMQLSGSEFEETNDVQVYCDCMIKEYQKFPLSTVSQDSFLDSKEGVLIDEKCTSQSIKK